LLDATYQLFEASYKTTKQKLKRIAWLDLNHLIKNYCWVCCENSLICDAIILRSIISGTPCTYSFDYWLCCIQLSTAMWSIKRWLYNSFGKCKPILILSLLHSDMNCRKTDVKIYWLASNLFSTYIRYKVTLYLWLCIAIAITRRHCRPTETICGSSQAKKKQEHILQLMKQPAVHIWNIRWD